MRLGQARENGMMAYAEKDLCRVKYLPKTLLLGLKFESHREI